MKCLQCGDCCTRFEILEINKKAGEKCYNLSDDNKCLIYTNRPQVCRDHSYPFDICPIGLKKQTKISIGKCMNCGSYIFNNDSFCSIECRDTFIKSLNDNNIENPNIPPRKIIYVESKLTKISRNNDILYKED